MNNNLWVIEQKTISGWVPKATLATRRQAREATSFRGKGTRIQRYVPAVATKS